MMTGKMEQAGLSGVGGLPQNIRRRWTEWSCMLLADHDLYKEMEETENDREHCEERVRDSFYKDLEFGTGGLRGIMGVGTNRMNIYTVARASQGYADYLQDAGRGSCGIALVIAYDSRLKSEKFAQTAAEVFAAAGIRVHLFPELMPTPVLSYAVRYLGCDGGVVITASHNPAQYNGYKVYGADGGQITEVVAGRILERINQVDIFTGTRKIELSRAVEEGWVSYIGQELMEAYYQAVSREAFGGEIDKKIKIVYTPLNGTGLKPVCEVLRRNGFINVNIVEEQRYPDGNFPTCPYPNPEKEEALSLAIRDAGRMNSEFALATDPDCDRVGIAVKTGKGKEGYRLLSGNETGVLLLDYVALRRREQGTMPERPIAFKTIVTTDLAGRVARSYGVEMRDVLTGFKYIGEQIGFLEAQGEEERFIMGLEESYGYLSGTYVRDKDGVNAVLLICEMAGYYKKKGMTLEQVLERIYRRYGCCLNTQHTFTFPGEEGGREMSRIMEKMRRAAVSYPALENDRMVKVDDYLASLSFTPKGGAVSLKLPKSNVLKMVWEDGTSLTARPSGTEPKLKIYISASGKQEENARIKEQKLVRWIREEFRLIS